MSTNFSRLELQKIAKYHRLFLWSIVAMMAGWLSLRFSNQRIFFLYFAAIVFQLFVQYKLGRALKFPVVLQILLILGWFVPILGLFIVASQHVKAMKTMKDAGVKVRFMGADPNTI